MALRADYCSKLLTLILSCLNMTRVDKTVLLFQDCHTMESLSHESPRRIKQNVTTLMHVDFLPCSQCAVYKKREFLCYCIYTNVHWAALRAVSKYTAAG